MNDNIQGVDFNRRDFLKGGSAATLLTMLGGVELFVPRETEAAEEPSGPKIKVAVVGLGPWGREILSTLGQLEHVEIAGICDNYPAMLRRSAKAAPGAAQTGDYNALLENKDIKAVIIATPTHLHKQLVLDALKAGKHVYCEAPLAHNLDEAKDIAKAAKAATPRLVFQAGLQFRSDKLRHFLLPFIRSGALGEVACARAQWHKKTPWRLTAPTPEREKDLNWRLEKQTSPGLIGEVGIHQIDQANWIMNALPGAINGHGATILWKDGRDIPDTVHADFEYPNGVLMNYTATLVNSFDANYEMFYGSYAAVMLRDTSAWMFKEVDSPLLGWEVYAKKEIFYKETGIVLRPDASKAAPSTEQEIKEALLKSNPLYQALYNFTKNAADIEKTTAGLIESYGEADPDELAKAPLRPAAGWQESYVATALALKAHEATLKNERLTIKPDFYELS